MIEFILNNSIVRTDSPPGMPLLDFVRKEMGLTGTKTGCREGDCGACTVMLGELCGNKLRYRTIVSCLTPLGNGQSKHVVTIEGLNGEHLSPIQQAIVNNSGTQCGFCTPGFVISLICHSLSGDSSDYKKTLASIDGNICRCTGYKSIEKAAREIYELNRSRKDEDAVRWMVQNNYLPAYFSSIPERLVSLNPPGNRELQHGTIIGGGTDLMVQKADEILEGNMDFISGAIEPDRIRLKEGYCTLDARVTASEIMRSEELMKQLPGLGSYLKLISSTQIRNMGTIGGNIVNASPIGDFTIIFLALDAALLINNPEGRSREISLRKFYSGHKELEWEENEYLESISFRIPAEGELFNFEKVSKREHLDIASVNTAIFLSIENELIKKVHLSAGGIAPIPKYLEETSLFLEGKKIDKNLLVEANKILQEEISPISDIRGSTEYKRLLLRQLFFAHFLVLCPDNLNPAMLTVNLVDR